MTSDQTVILVLGLSGSFIAVLAWLNHLAIRRDERAELRAIHPAE